MFTNLYIYFLKIKNNGCIIPTFGKDNAPIKLGQLSQIMNDYHNIINDLV